MGVSDFEQLSPLPAVPVEIELINDLWPGSAFLNEGFTRQTLIEERQQSPYRLIHLATHAEFKPGSPDNSYIQLWDEQLKLSELHRLGWQYPAVDLLVLSACSTAVGSPEAEMGFAGLAIAAGVRSAMASLWSVSDVGTLALMSEFYEQLQAQPTKSEALQVAQLAMINGDVHTVDGQLIGNAARSGVAIPSQLGTLGRTNFSHPYYWSGFTMIGSPW
ncbi:MAG: CHAT domain-containing protein [Cyanobacteria bacterium J06576_12]